MTVEGHAAKNLEVADPMKNLIESDLIGDFDENQMQSLL
jgi:hypothetical protein